MKLTGELKAKVESAAGMEDKKALIAEAGMELNDEELAAVAGGTLDIGGTREIISSSAPVFKSSDNPHPILMTLKRGTQVTFIDGSETEGAPAMSFYSPSYSPLIYITSPVSGWIPRSAIE